MLLLVVLLLAVQYAAGAAGREECDRHRCVPRGQPSATLLTQLSALVCFLQLGYGAGTFLEAFQVLEPSDPSVGLAFCFLARLRVCQQVGLLFQVPIWFNADPSGQLCVGTESSIWDCQNLPVDFTNTASDGIVLLCQRFEPFQADFVV